MNLDALELEALVRERRIRTVFQPMVSVKRKAVFAVEALSRGLSRDGKGLVAPGVLFAAAGAAGRRLELDRLCRECALASFQPLHEREKSLILSINLDVSTLNPESACSRVLLGQVQQYGIDPNNVLIEIIESEVEDTQSLLDFIEFYRAQGFLIAIDDIGAGHSNLDRVAFIKPDVIKVDRSLISDIDKGFRKLEITRSLASLGRKVGALVVAEGVERVEEAMQLLELGVDVFQGFYFARPAPAGEACRKAPQTVNALAESFKRHRLASISERRRRHERYEVILRELLRSLENTEHPASPESALIGFLTAYPNVECLYVLDEAGLQCSDTICNPFRIAEHKRFLYQPAQRGTDHSLKDYFLPLQAGLQRFTTDEYISLASGNLCTTISARYLAKDKVARIACMDISTGQADAVGLA